MIMEVLGQRCTYLMCIALQAYFMACQQSIRSRRHLSNVQNKKGPSIEVSNLNLGIPCSLIDIDNEVCCLQGQSEIWSLPAQSGSTEGQSASAEQTKVSRDDKAITVLVTK